MVQVTSPAPYNTPRKNWLLRYIGVQEKYDHLIATSLRDASDDAAKHMLALGGKDTIGKTVRRYQLGLARKAIHGVIAVFFRDLIPVIQAGQSDAAVAAVEAGFANDARIMRRLFPDNSDRQNWEASYRQTASRNVQSMMKRILDTQIPLSTRVYHSRSLANGYVDRTINSGLARGASVGELAKAVRDSIRPDTAGGVGYAAKRLARTEINNAYHAQAISDFQDKPWVDYVAWRLSKTHKKTGCVCEQYAQAERWDRNHVPRKPHPQCVTGDTLVQIPGGRPIAVTSRRHFGELIEITTLKGKHLTVTPNHPILTVDGWVFAGKLNEGARVIDGWFHQGESFGRHPYEQHVPARAEDVFTAFNESVGSSARSVVSVHAEDFHGDGVHSDVAIVGANSFLQRYISEISEPVCEHQFNGVYSNLSLFSGLSSFASSFEGFWDPSNSFVRSTSPFAFLFGSSFGKYQSGDLLWSPHGDVGLFTKPVPQSEASNWQIEHLDQFTWGFPRHVEIDDVLSIRVIPHSSVGHMVYNFQTITGWYRANSIITHNCMCYIVPVLTPYDEFERKLLAGDYDQFIEANS